MREIKFNFYNTFTKEYIRWDKANAFMNMSAFCTHEHLRFLQYTGLKDKNGVEIYEGDIFLEWEDGLYRWIVQWNGELGRWELREPDIAEIFYEEDMLATIENGELKGNIHENPELLEVPK